LHTLKSIEDFQRPKRNPELEVLLGFIRRTQKAVQVRGVPIVVVSTGRANNDVEYTNKIGFWGGGEVITKIQI
jgi:hypothetical protein